MAKITFCLPLLLTGSLWLSANTITHAATDIIKPNFAHALPNIPDKSIKTLEVFYPPGAASLPHTHAPSAFIYAYVVEGKIVSQVAGQPKRTYQAGESWYENPGAHHLISRNASKTKPAKLLAVFIVDSNEKNLTIPDKQETKHEPAN